MKIRVKRIYEPAEPSDGCRILVDRLWPRGVSKASASVDSWMKDLGPSNGLRRWFGHDPERWAEFKRRYFVELDGSPELVDEVQALARGGRVTLLYSARDEEHNQAVALAQYLVAR